MPLCSSDLYTVCHRQEPIEYRKQTEKWVQQCHCGKEPIAPSQFKIFLLIKKKKKPKLKQVVGLVRSNTKVLIGLSVCESTASTGDKCKLVQVNIPR